MDYIISTDLILFFLLFGIGLLIVLFFMKTIYKNDVIEVSYKGFDYYVLNKADSQKAVEMLHTIRNNLLRLAKRMSSKFPHEANIVRMHEVIQQTKFMESSDEFDYETFTKNKGDEMVLCLRYKSLQNIHDLNTLMFVAIHELGHIMTRSFHHTDEFWKNFKRLLQEATKMKIYSAEDYSKSPQKYCNMKITDNPLFNL